MCRTCGFRHILFFIINQVMILRIAVLSLLLSVLSLSGASQTSQQDSTIVEHLKSRSEDRVNVYQSVRLFDRLHRGDATYEGIINNVDKQGNSVGYRIQVFSDNNPRSAKNEAMIKERNILARFPLLSSYLTYRAPSWRLRVGDFRTREEAMHYLHQLKEAFPSYAREMILVKDRINTK